MITERLCLVIMPFGKTKDERLFYDLVYDHVISPAVSDARIEHTRLDRQHLADRTLNEALQQRLQDAPLVIADLSGNNPNVLFELGYRWAQKKPFVCLSNQPSEAAFWPKFFQIIDYTAPNATANIATAISEAWNRGMNRPHTEDGIVDLLELVRPDGFEHSLKDRFASWRTQMLRSQLVSIKNAELELEALSSPAYVAHLFNGVMDLLQAGDEYVTVSNLKFWSDTVVGQSAFLKANVHAAERGASIRRTILVDEADLKNASSRETLEMHARAMEQVQESQLGHMDVKCLVATNMGRALQKYRHFGIARTAKLDNSMLVVPRFQSPAGDGDISHLRFVFSGDMQNDDLIREQAGRFERAFALSDNVRAVLADRRWLPRRSTRSRSTPAHGARPDTRPLPRR